MPGLTVTEKNTGRIASPSGSNARSRPLKASDPSLFTRLNREARAQTLHGRGLADLSRRLRRGWSLTEPRASTGVVRKHGNHDSCGALGWTEHLGWDTIESW